jgi:hypothetical protein
MRRNAPAVTYPLGASSLCAFALALPWALAAAVCAIWSLQPGAPRLAAGMALACVLVAPLGGWLACRHARAAQLCWDGRQWALQQDQAQQHGTLELVLDGQVLLLLIWRGPQTGVRWLWLQRGSEPRRWADLRRAVYASAVRGQPDTATRPGPAP